MHTQKTLETLLQHILRRMQRPSQQPINGNRLDGRVRLSDRAVLSSPVSRTVSRLGSWRIAISVCFVLIVLMVGLSAPVKIYANEISAFNKDYAQILERTLIRQTFTSQYGTFEHSAVNYQQLVQDPLVTKLIAKEVARLKTMPTPPHTRTHLAFWINAYNFFTLKAIVAAYPVSSMKKVGWKQKNIAIGTRTLSLDEIEHKIIRPLGDARTHFALNCASVSCPTLLHRPFRQANLDQTLDSLTQQALRSPIHIRQAVKGFFGGEKLGVSKLFKWYKEDFYHNGASLASFITKYKPAALKVDAHAGVTYLGYNWDLNTSENINAYIAELHEIGLKMTRVTQ